MNRAYHFVSKANLVNMPIDDPMSPARQAQIKALVDRLSAFHPTKVVLEETSDPETPVEPPTRGFSEGESSPEPFPVNSHI